MKRERKNSEVTRQERGTDELKSDSKSLREFVDAPIRETRR
jgi:hypothetical protein